MKNRVLYILILTLLFSSFVIQAQDDSINPAALYRPKNYKQTIMTTPPDTTGQVGVNAEQPDSARMKFIQDSILARQIFIRDSIIARENLLRRKQILDSLQTLRAKLPALLEAGLWLHTDQFIIDRQKIDIIGDSVLGNFTYVFLPFSFNKPYVPWVSSVPLSKGSVTINFDDQSGKITSIKGPSINWKYEYSPSGKIIIINEQSIVATKYSKKYYKVLFDSVFFNSRGNIAKIKRYAHFYQANDKYQKGAFLFTNLYEIKQFEYAPDNSLKYFEIINFCDRWLSTDVSKVCQIVKYTISKQVNSYSIERKNDPSNGYAEGNYIFEFDNMHHLKWVSFTNVKKTENWKTTIELNEKG